MKKIAFAFLLVIVLMLTAVNLDAEANTVPKIFIQGVTKDEKVTIVTQNFPANRGVYCPDECHWYKRN